MIPSPCSHSGGDSQSREINMKLTILNLSRARIALALLMVLATVAMIDDARAWGPHTEITRWALRQLPASDRVAQRLGGVRQMEDLCWGGDYQHFVHARYYVDDYLLFPKFPRHTSHVLPEVAEAWEPFFRRTLQALRGESPQNAARWLGSYLHFVEDSGSPPHALPTGGPLHFRMENYVLNVRVRLTGYHPPDPPAADDAAAERMEQRMRALVAFSRERGIKLRPLAEKDDRLACEPLVLESALETLRVTADVTHWLLKLSETGPRPGTATLRGEIRAPAMPDFPLAPTKVILAGTNYSTIADARASRPGGHEYRADFVLADLPPGEYEVIFLRTGCQTRRKRVRLVADKARTLRLKLKGDSPRGNLVRNPDMSVRWIRPDHPDHWTVFRGDWYSRAFPVIPGQRYEIGARDADGPREVFVRTSDNPRMPNSSRVVQADKQGVFTATTHYAQLAVQRATPVSHCFVRPAASTGKGKRRVECALEIGHASERSAALGASTCGSMIESSLCRNKDAQK